MKARRNIYFDIPSPDDWYPTINGHVKVGLHDLVTTVNKVDQYRVSVWGGDDCGMEIDLDSEIEAIAIFMRIRAMELITKSQLKTMGFVPA